MKIILTKDVEKLGKTGQVVTVKDGYARNFLIPSGCAVYSSPGNLKQIEIQKQKQRQLQEQAQKEAQGTKERLEGLSLTIPVLTQEGGGLYGAITAIEIAKALKEEGIEIDKGVIELKDHIKALGIYEIPLKLHPEITATLKVWVVGK